MTRVVSVIQSWCQLDLFACLLRLARALRALAVRPCPARNELRAERRKTSCDDAAQRSGARTIATLLPFSRIVSRCVVRRPSGVISLRRPHRRRAVSGCALGLAPARASAAECTAQEQHALFCDVLQHHVDVHVKAAQRADKLLVALHYDLEQMHAAHTSAPARCMTRHVLQRGLRLCRPLRKAASCMQGTHPEARADALVDKLAGQQVRRIAARLLGRQRRHAAGTTAAMAQARARAGARSPKRAFFMNG